MQIKIGLGKLGLNVSLKELVEDQQKNGIEILPVKLEHLWQLEVLPHLHGDPFDRILAAQALREGMKLVTGDAKIAQYPVEVLW
jgi:PIN domain nuclease of toxin-antitoxin system